jgi:hypothetical protein
MPPGNPLHLSMFTLGRQLRWPPFPLVRRPGVDPGGSNSCRNRFPATLAPPLLALEQGQTGLRLLPSARDCHEPGNPMATELPAYYSAQLPVDPPGSVATALRLEHRLEHRLDPSGDHGVLGRARSRRLLPLLPGEEAAAGYGQRPAQPGSGPSPISWSIRRTLSAAAALRQSALSPA